VREEPPWTKRGQNTYARTSTDAVVAHSGTEGAPDGAAVQDSVVE